MTAVRRSSAGVLLVVLVVVVVVLVLLWRTLHTSGGGAAPSATPSTASTSPSSSSSTSAAPHPQTSPRDFLREYVTASGRVVRRDQGGDTVSEGQAYAMLLAAADDRPEVFGRVWTWTRGHLLRSDGLLSWRWDGTQVADPSSASDADLDAARALVVAGTRFERADWTREGVALGRAVLDHETVPTPQGLVLVAGQWATSGPPYAFNPSYVSPVATRLLGKASGDPRWAQLDHGSQTALGQATPPGGLPPDWAQVDADGVARPAGGPAGAPVQFGYDAARTIVRQAESCRAADVRYAAAARRVLDSGPSAAVLDLGGAPQTDSSSPLALVAEAAGQAAGGNRAGALRDLTDAASLDVRTPTYYGAAWAALGRVLLTERVLGGCPPAVGS